MKPTKKMKILWAVDAFDDLREIQEQEVKMLLDFAKRTEIEVDPVYVLSPVELRVPLEFTMHWGDVYLPAAKKAVAQRLEQHKIPGLKEPVVLFQNRASLSSAVETLTRFAAARSYDLIVAGSHGRKGLQRMMLGSFAEQLLLRSETPVLIFGNQAQEPASSEMDILVPSDLENVHAPFFGEIFDFAESLKAKITLLSSIPTPVKEVFQSGVYLLTGGWVPTPHFLEKEKGERVELGKTVLNEAERRHLAHDLVVDNTSPTVTESILSQAREKQIRFIAMAAESGPLATALLGSITRQIVRMAPCPVLVYPSSRKDRDK